MTLQYIQKLLMTEFWKPNFVICSQNFMEHALIHHIMSQIVYDSSPLSFVSFTFRQQVLQVSTVPHVIETPANML